MAFVEAFCFLLILPHAKQSQILTNFGLSKTGVNLSKQGKSSLVNRDIFKKTVVFFKDNIIYTNSLVIVSVVYLCHNFFCGTLSDQHSPVFISNINEYVFVLKKKHSIMDHLISLPVSNMAGIGGFPCNICSFVTDQHIFFLQDYFRKQKLFHCMYQKLIKYKKHETALFFFYNLSSNFIFIRPESYGS